jgi:short-subunit dehydrogenase
MVALNIQGLLYVAHAALPHLLRAAEREPRQVADLVNVSSVAGRRVGAGGGIYQMTKHGVGVFSEALRQEITGRYVRSSLIEPGATQSELVTHVREEVRNQLTANVGQTLRAEDIADAVLYIVTQSVSHGRRAGMASVAGITTGTLVHIAAATIGLSALLASSAVSAFVLPVRVGMVRILPAPS